VLSETKARKADIASLLELANTFGDDEHLAEAYYRQAFLGGNIADPFIMDQAIPVALAAARRCGNQAIEARALVLNSNLTAYHGDEAAISQFAEEALQLARRLGDENVLAFVLLRASWAYGEMGNTAKTAPLLIEQVELDHRLGNRAQEANGLGNLGAGYLSLGMYKQARSLLEQSRDINKALGARRTLAYSLGNLGDLYLETGDLRKARQLFEEALHEMAPSQDARGKYWLLNEMGLVLLEMGDAPAAVRSFEEALQCGRQIDAKAYFCNAPAGLAACALVQGKLEEARQYAHEVWDYIKEHGYMHLNGPGEVFHIIADTFDALGETENLEAVLVSAHQALMELAEKIDEPEWRKSFFENVPQNRAIMEMWEGRKK
jgi:tetratricopeptide (TPR) repeat protein